MVINIADADECRIATLNGGRLDELYVERVSSVSHVGNVYKGRVTNVEPSIQAAFVDFGLATHGFLHITDLHPQYFPDHRSDSEQVGRKTPRRERPPIQRCLRRGQEVIVQITKEGIGTKGPTLTTYISVPGRFVVMMPGMNQLGVSRKIEDEDTRRTLREMLSQLSLLPGMGFIMRTAAIDRTKRDLQQDLTYLTRLWRAVEERIRTERAPCVLYQESDLVIRTIRDVFDADVKRILCDDVATARRIADFLAIASPRSRDVVFHYNGPDPIFHAMNIESEIDKLHSKEVPLACGGSIVIEPT
jgi:ribonuclease E